VAVNAKLRRDLIKLTIFVVVSVLITVSVVATLLDLKLGQAQTGYHALFANASDLEPGDVVRIAGVEVGKVTGVSVTRDYHALVSFTVESSQHLTSNTVASIEFENLLGQRYLQISQPTPGGVPLHGGATIGCAARHCGPADEAEEMAHTQPGLDLTTVFTGFQPLIAALNPAQVNELTGSIIEVLQGDSTAVGSLINQTATLTANLASKQQLINQVIDNLAPLLSTVNADHTQLDQLIRGLATLTTGLAGERQAVGGAVSGLAALNDNTANLYNGIEPALDQDLQGLENVTNELTNNQGQLNQTGTQLGAVLAGLPGLLNALDRASQSGSFLTVYLCDLSITTSGPISVKLSPGVPQSPPLSVPNGLVGVPTYHSGVCGP
jgi:phospholipid/cholesterol/gamma-HCH transport system substrate-binding protein